jgi:predicted Na+-dependent transporter
MLSTLERSIACWLLAATIAVGFAIPGISELFARFTFPSLLVMIILSLVPMGRFDFEQVFSLDRNVWKVVLWQLFALPAIVVAAAHLAKINVLVTALMVTTASAGSLFASPTFAELLQVNKQRALQCMILSTFLMPISYFIFFTLVLHSAVTIDVLHFTYRCIIFLVLPLGLFLVYMGFARAFPEKLVESFESGSRRLTIFALMVFGLGIVGPARDLMWVHFNQFILYLAVVIFLGAGMAYLTAVVMFRQGITDAITASIVSGFRNVGLGFVLLSGVSSENTAVYVGISQIPIFLAPLVFSFLVRESRSPDSAFAIA